MAGVALTLVRDQMEAEALCGMLRANGIKCGYRYSDMAAGIVTATGGFPNEGPIEVLVEQDQLMDAQKLLPRDQPSAT